MSLLARTTSALPTSTPLRQPHTPTLPAAVQPALTAPSRACRQARGHAHVAWAGNMSQGNNAPIQKEPIPPKVTLPPVQPEVPPPQFGFVDNAERINSRACMIGFFALLALEGTTKTGLLDMLGFVTGQGLGFEL